MDRRSVPAEISDGTEITYQYFLHSPDYIIIDDKDIIREIAI